MSRSQVSRRTVSGLSRGSATPARRAYNWNSPEQLEQRGCSPRAGRRRAGRRRAGRRTYRYAAPPRGTERGGRMSLFEGGRPFLDALPAQDRRALLALGRHRTYEPSQIVLREHDRTTFVVAITSG